MEVYIVAFQFVLGFSEGNSVKLGMNLIFV